MPGREDAVLAATGDPQLRARIEELANKNNEGLLTGEEMEEYTGYVKANKFVAVLRREARKFKSGSAAAGCDEGKRQRAARSPCF